LSISEFIGFSWAYLIAAVASTVLITWYCNFFLGGGVRTLMIGAGLGGVYLFLYITLRQQDYALLMGAIALFIVLAIVMYVTRKIDWYARDASLNSGSLLETSLRREGASVSTCLKANAQKSMLRFLSITYFFLKDA